MPRLQEIRLYAHRMLLYYATAYSKLPASALNPNFDPTKWTREQWEAKLILTEMDHMGHVLALAEGTGESDEAIVGRYIAGVMGSSGAA